MRYSLIFLPALICCAWARVEAKPQAPPPQASGPPTAPQTEKVEVPGPTPTPSQVFPAEPGQMEPARVEALLHKIWLAEFRINDLLGQVQPQRWKLSGVARDSFSRTLQALGSQLAELEKWRAQFEKRTDSVYLGYETYVAINAVLPRLDGVARSIAKYENSSLAAQYTQAGNQLFDLQQAVEPYLGFLLRNQDELFLAMQGNLAACQNQLGYAMRGRTQAAVPLKNVLPNFKGHPRLHRTKIILDWTEPAGATVQQPRKKRGGSKKFKVTLEEKETTGAPAPRKLQENKP